MNLKKIILFASGSGSNAEKICKYFEKTDYVKKLDLKLGHDLHDESFVKNWFKKNKSEQYLQFQPYPNALGLGVAGFLQTIRHVFRVSILASLHWKQVANRL